MDHVIWFISYVPIICNMNNSDTTKYNVDEVLREAISSLKNDSRFLSITIQPENYDEQKSNVLQPVKRQTEIF